MKIKIISLAIIMLFNFQATEYKVTLDSKHYKNSIVIQPTGSLTPPVTDPENNSPFTEKNYILLI
jgi:hypothetical protein